MLRQLALEETDQAATVLRASFDQALPTLAGLHTPDEDRWFFRNRLFVDCQVWGYFNDQELVGIIAFRAGWIDRPLPGNLQAPLGPAIYRDREL